MDRRITKTKNKIHRALLDILDTMDLKDISVSRLCKEAKIHRSTFYVHYDNVSQCFDQISDAVIEEMRQALFESPVRTQRMYLRVYFQTARKHQTVFKAIHRNNIHDPMIKKMVDINNEVLGQGLYIPDQNEHLFYSFVFSGFFGMVAAWLDHGCKEEDEALISVMETISSGKL